MLVNSWLRANRHTRTPEGAHLVHRLDRALIGRVAREIELGAEVIRHRAGVSDLAPVVEPRRQLGERKVGEWYSMSDNTETHNFHLPDSGDNRLKAGIN